MQVISLDDYQFDRRIQKAYGFDQQNSLDDQTVCKAYDAYDLLKGLRANEGEERLWGERKYKKVAGKWKFVGKGSKHSQDSKKQSVANNIENDFHEGYNHTNRKLKGYNVGKKPSKWSEHHEAGSKAAIEHHKVGLSDLPAGAFEKYEESQREAQKKVPNAQVTDLLKTLQVSDVRYKDWEKITVQGTPKGNWRVYYDGRDTGLTYNSKYLSDSTVEKFGLAHHDDEEEFNQSKETKTHSIKQLKEHLENTSTDQLKKVAADKNHPHNDVAKRELERRESESKKSGGEKLSKTHEQLDSLVKQLVGNVQGWAGTGELAQLHSDLADTINDLEYDKLPIDQANGIEDYVANKGYKEHIGYSKTPKEALDRHTKGISKLAAKLNERELKQAIGGYLIS